MAFHLNQGDILKRIFFVLLLAFLTGCVTQPTIKIHHQFDEAEARELLKPGTNTIKGSALLRQRGGGVVTCAGIQVALVPSTAYASERFLHIYGNYESGYASRMPGQFDPDLDSYKQQLRTTTCDAQGFFKFDNVANGVFHVVTVITWRINDYSQEGGSMMQRVRLNGGEVKEIVLTSR